MLDEPHIRLRALREKAGFAKPIDAARRFGWNVNTYKSHENGNRDISRDAADQYARAFNSSIDWILHGRTPTKNGDTLTPDETALILGFRRLPPEARHALAQLVRAMPQVPEEEIPESDRARPLTKVG